MLSRLFYLIHCLFRALGGLKCRLRRPEPFILFTLKGEYTPLSPPKEGFLRGLFRRPKPNIKELVKDLERVGSDPRVEGVVLRLYRPQLSLASLQTLYNTLLYLKKKGKKVITWAPNYDSMSYFLALAADTILLQEGGEISSLGLSRRFLFLTKGLKHWGLGFDLLSISPYKSAGDRFTKERLSQEARAMEEWILEDIYQQYLEVLMEGLAIERERAIEIMDKGPYLDKEALKEGLIHQILSQEEIPTLLGTQEMVSFKDARRKLYREPPSRPGGGVALIRVEGTIVDGESKKSPLPLPIPLLMDPRAGDLTVVEEVRKACRDKRCKAVVLYIDSGGGSATASEAMTQALFGLAGKKPLVVSMGSTAASGGYYITTPADYIFAHPLTITGSIGVLGGKLVDEGLIEKLLFHREIISRGKSALFNDSSRPYTEEERERVWKKIQRTYTIFLQRVAKGREMRLEEVDAVGGGRVYTGRQAKEKGLVDELGGLEEAIKKAKELAHLPERSPVWEIGTQKRESPPLGEAQALLEYVREGISIYGRGESLCILPFVEEREGL